MKNIKSAVTIAYRVLNTIGRKSFSKHLSTPWNCFLATVPQAVIKAIQEKAVHKLTYSLKAMNTFSSLDDVIAVLDDINKAESLHILKKDRSRMLTQLSFYEAQLLRLLVWHLNDYPSYEANSQARFSCSEVLNSLFEYFLVQDGITNGAPEGGFGDILKKALTTQSASFFKEGYIGDLFVVDRIAASKSSTKRFIVRSRSDYLSTINSDEALFKERHNDYRLLIEHDKVS